MGSEIGTRHDRRVKGFARQKATAEIYRAAQYTVDFLPQIKSKLSLRPARKNRGCRRQIIKAARTGKSEEKVFVSRHETAIRIPHRGKRKPGLGV